MGRHKHSETHFPCGHERIETNIYWHDCYAKCKICKNKIASRYHQSRPEETREYGKRWRQKQKQETQPGIRTHYMDGKPPLVTAIRLSAIPRCPLEMHWRTAAPRDAIEAGEMTIEE